MKLTLILEDDEAPFGQEVKRELGIDEDMAHGMDFNEIIVSMSETLKESKKPI